MYKKFGVVLAACLVSASASATVILTANLTNSQEIPPTNPTTAAGAPRASSGSATFTLNDAQTELAFTATVFGIDVTGTQSADVNDNLTAAHLHAGPLVTSANTGPAVWGFFGAPFNDNNPNNYALTPLASGVGGTFSGKWDVAEGNNTTLTAQLTNILDGHAYINFHTTQFSGGEIRGALVQAPEPGALGLMLGGGLLLAAAHRRRNMRQA